MLVFWKENLVLLAVPKTGTTALQGALAPKASMVLRDPPTLKHAPVYRYRRFVKPMFVQVGGQEPEVMAIVRHPIDWLGSWYRYRRREKLKGLENSTHDVSFDEFVLEYIKGKPAPFAAVGSQAKFVSDGDGILAVDHLFRYEAQTAIVDYLEQRLDMKIALKRKNVSPKMELELSPEVEARLRQKRSNEFDVWEQGRTI